MTYLFNFYLNLDFGQGLKSKFDNTYGNTFCYSGDLLDKSLREWDSEKLVDADVAEQTASTCIAQYLKLTKKILINYAP